MGRPEGIGMCWIGGARGRRRAGGEGVWQTAGNARTTYNTVSGFSALFYIEVLNQAGMNQ